MAPTTRRDPPPEPGTPLTISVVIPTRNRDRSLARALAALARQERAPEEVIVVDAGDEPLGEDALRRDHPRLTVRYHTAAPGVCAQRNLGIRVARGSHVLLLDDDVEPPPDYVERLARYLETHPAEGAVTGLLSEPDARGIYREGFEMPSFRHLLFAFVFQLTVWGDVEAARGGPLTAAPLALIRRWYRHRGNTWSLAGWPLVTAVGAPVVRTAVYGLGGALIRRDWLLASPYDEALGPHGIGDNYGVALGFPGERSVVVLTDLPVLHHRAPANRLEAGEAWFRRVLALDYFLRTSPRFSALNTGFLAWSLAGSSLRFALRGERALLRRSLMALGLVVRGRNPLLRGGRTDGPATVGAPGSDPPPADSTTVPGSTTADSTATDSTTPDSPKSDSATSDSASATPDSATLDSPGPASPTPDSTTPDSATPGPGAPPRGGPAS